MNHRQIPGVVGLFLWCAVFSAAMASGAFGENAGAAAPVVLDRVVAVVNRQVILESDVEDEIRLSVIDPNQVGQDTLTPQRALEQLIARALVEQQIREQDAEAAMPTSAEVARRIAELRRQLPACAHANCAQDAGWKAFLAAHGLTPDGVETYMRYRMEILRFIEMRFRAGTRISQPEIESYYRNTLLPQYRAGEAAPPLDQVASRIEEILLEQRVNVLFDEWLKNLRKQGNVQILDPALNASDSASEPANSTNSAPDPGFANHAPPSGAAKAAHPMGADLGNNE